MSNVKVKGEIAPRVRQKDLYRKSDNGMHVVVVETNAEVAGSVNMVERYEDMGFEVEDGQDPNRQRVRMVIPQEEWDAREKEHQDKARALVDRRTFDPGQGVRDSYDRTETLGRGTLESQIAIGREESKAPSPQAGDKEI